MSRFDYVEVPSYAKRLESVPQAIKDEDSTRPTPAVMTSLPHAKPSSDSSMFSPTTQPISPSRTFGNLPGMLLASSLQLPTNMPSGNMRNSAHLLSTRDPLSVPITTVNFRRFIAKVGFVFWLQDRLEEILMWKKGWKVTGMWMAVYTFLCYFPRLILLLPHAILLGVLLATHPSRHLSNPELTNSPPALPPLQHPPRANAREGSADWLANIQGIQNLMGAFSDVFDTLFPLVHHLTYSTPYTPHILTITFLTLLLALPLLPLIPLRPLFLVLGLCPFFLTHPITRRTLPVFLSILPLAHIHAWIARVVDNDRMKDEHWQSPLREVELFENERWAPGESGLAGAWGKSLLKSGERVAWTRGQDGWSGISADGSGDVSNLTFALDAEWAFVETEDWRPDIEARWTTVDAGEHGWVYTNDAWLGPRSSPLDEWMSTGVDIYEVQFIGSPHVLKRRVILCDIIVKLTECSEAHLFLT
ncbi:hypothetical protein EW146_g803 [Bondarzewia mesenterica]|uniref:TECPR1-like DysF domain-containing protein n=1 Tax=Bondarzewia mesenterica TaxID=1095465 RepID=A0A4S4M5U3_9AGAM|nr:hypothetical protein EW146_g803 [Bondarzewia mesenterica]